mmetsp:Transcript_12785/g.28098  ORF Transcript_12785/g.28098 Transcript_12785/m.28098 type:complete len:102 (-) Transcript_12785:176-481(-)
MISNEIGVFAFFLVMFIIRLHHQSGRDMAREDCLHEFAFGCLVVLSTACFGFFELVSEMYFEEAKRTAAHHLFPRVGAFSVFSSLLMSAVLATNMECAMPK